MHSIMQSSYLKLGFHLMGLVFLILLFSLSSCRKNQVDSNPNLLLEFSTDTLQFDTVFSTVGSVTRSFRVRNPSSKSVEISKITLVGGTVSNFRINIDGIPTDEITDVQIAPNDSLWIFVEVTVDPASSNLPYVIEDNIAFLTNGNAQNVKLVAWGQEAYFFDRESVACDTTWRDEKPYVVYGWLQVDSGCTLTITEGCRIHFHGGSAILVDGTLQALGTSDSLIRFEDDRLENEISDKPGMWDGIYFLRSSSGNLMRHCHLKNASSGISVGFSKMPYSGAPDVGGTPSLTLEQVEIWNVLGSGITGFAATIVGENVLVYHVGGYALQMVLGGSYRFRNGTFVNYGSSFVDHKTPLVAIANNFIDANEVQFAANIDSAVFENCIIDGNITSDDEVVLSNVTAADFNVAFRFNLIRSTLALGTDNLYNQNPQFLDRGNRDFNLSSSSPAVDAANAAALSIDLFGRMRDANPDIGATEFFP